MEEARLSRALLLALVGFWCCTLSGGGKFASASYLDELGQMSQVMSEFINAALEKVSFLAELVIESALAEQCDFNCEQADNSSATAKTIDSSSTSEGLMRVAADRIDKSEFTDAQLFLDSFEWAQGAAKKKEQKKVEEKKDGSDELEAGCSLLGFALESRDLPLAEMELCCRSYRLCYANCASSKLHCDLHYRACLTSLCRQKLLANESASCSGATQSRSPRASASWDQLDSLGFEPTASDDDDDDNDDEDDHFNHDHDQRESAKKRKRNSARRELESNQEEDEEEETNQAPNERELRRRRDKYKACKLAAKVLIIGNLAFGCQAYKLAQRQACCKWSGSTTTT